MKGGLHEFSIMGEKGNQRSIVIQRFLGVY